MLNSMNFTEKMSKLVFERLGKVFGIERIFYLELPRTEGSHGYLINIQK